MQQIKLKQQAMKANLLKWYFVQMPLKIRVSATFQLQSEVNLILTDAPQNSLPRDIILYRKTEDQLSSPIHTH